MTDLEPYGLSPEFEGLRWIKRHGDEPPRELGLAHGDPQADPAGVVISKTAGVETAGAEIDILDRLATMLWLAENEAPAGREGTRELADWTRDLLAAVPGPDAWEDDHLQVDGVRTPVRLLHGERGWTAMHELDHSFLALRSVAEQPSCSI